MLEQYTGKIVWSRVTRNAVYFAVALESLYPMKEVKRGSPLITKLEAHHEIHRLKPQWDRSIYTYLHGGQQCKSCWMINMNKDIVLKCQYKLSNRTIPYILDHRRFHQLGTENDTGLWVTITGKCNDAPGCLKHYMYHISSIVVWGRGEEGKQKYQTTLQNENGDEGLLPLKDTISKEYIRLFPRENYWIDTLGYNYEQPPTPPPSDDGDDDDEGIFPDELEEENSDNSQTFY